MRTARRAMPKTSRAKSVAHVSELVAVTAA